MCAHIILLLIIILLLFLSTKNNHENFIAFGIPKLQPGEKPAQIVPINTRYPNY